MKAKLCRHKPYWIYLCTVSLALPVLYSIICIMNGTLTSSTGEINLNVNVGNSRLKYSNLSKTLDKNTSVAYQLGNKLNCTAAADKDTLAQCSADLLIMFLVHCKQLVDTGAWKYENTSNVW